MAHLFRHCQRQRKTTRPFTPRSFCRCLFYTCQKSSTNAPHWGTIVAALNVGEVSTALPDTVSETKLLHCPTYYSYPLRHPVPPCQEHFDPVPNSRKRQRQNTAQTIFNQALGSAEVAIGNIVDRRCAPLGFSWRWFPFSLRKKF